jgi:formylglycine-generating enzyme required for sulfatase activity
MRTYLWIGAVVGVLSALAIGVARRGGPCPAGLEATGPLGACCLPGQSAWVGTCSGPATACPEGHDLHGGACVRRELPAFDAVRVEPGSFTMGCTEERDGNHVCLDNAPYEVTLTKPYVIMTTEVTQALYTALVGTNPSRLVCDACPVHNVSWLDAARFANALSAWEGRVAAYGFEGEKVTFDPTADGWRLPTEAEWEYAARADEETPYAGGSDLDAVAWTERNASGTQPVGTKQPNAWGLYDMSGNVWEWTNTSWHPYPTTPTVDPAPWDTHEQRIVRGGAWSGIPGGVYLSSRGFIPVTFADVILGFRLARNAGPGDAPAR